MDPRTIAKQAKLTQERLKALLKYDPETGVFTWLVSRGKARAGAVAGWIGNGYVRLDIDGMHFQAHRVAWFYVTGAWPADEIDHRDLDKANNRWVNLREATTPANHQNMPMLSNNTSGYRGVFWHKTQRKWISAIKINGRLKHLGCFDDPARAYAAYVAAKAELHPFHPEPPTVPGAANALER